MPSGPCCLKRLKTVYCSSRSRYEHKRFFSEKTVQLIHSRKDELHSELVGSWTVRVGDLDQSLHLWKHTGGFAGIDSAIKILATEKVSYVLKKKVGFKLH